MNTPKNLTFPLIILTCLFGTGYTQTYINISDTTTACNSATAGEYWFMSEAPIDSTRANCLAENFGSSYSHTLVVIESLEEGNCLVRYINDEYDVNANEIDYAIGLADSNVEGVWEWDTLGDDSFGRTTTYEHWAPDSPKIATNDCAFFAVSDTLAISGFWQDVACNTVMNAICERIPLEEFE